MRCKLQTSSNCLKYTKTQRCLRGERDSQEHDHRFTVDDLCEFNRSVCYCNVACNVFVCGFIRVACLRDCRVDDDDDGDVIDRSAVQYANQNISAYEITCRIQSSVYLVVFE